MRTNVRITIVGRLRPEGNQMQQELCRQVAEIIATQMYTDDFELKLNEWLRNYYEQTHCRPTTTEADSAESCPDCGTQIVQLYCPRCKF